MISALASMGFTSALESSSPKRLILAVEGGDGAGKTRFALSAPGPIVYMSTDPTGLEGAFDCVDMANVLKKKYVFSPKRVALIAQKALATRDPLAKSLNVDDRADAEEALALWNAFRGDHIKVVNAAVASQGRDVRTLIWDLGTDVYSLCKLAHFLPMFGRMGQIPSMAYGPPKADFTELMTRAADQPYMNFITIWKQKAVYKSTADGKEYKSNETKLEGPEDIVNYHARVRIKLYSDYPAKTHANPFPAPAWKGLILKCTHNPMLLGQPVEDADEGDSSVNFPRLASLATMTDEAQWR